MRSRKLADVDKDGKLSEAEFVIGMHLVTMCKLGKLQTLPSTIPQALLDQAGWRASDSEGDSGESFDPSREDCVKYIEIFRRFDRDGKGK